MDATLREEPVKRKQVSLWTIDYSSESSGAFSHFLSVVPFVQLACLFFSEAIHADHRLVDSTAGVLSVAALISILLAGFNVWIYRVGSARANALTSLTILFGPAGLWFGFNHWNLPLAGAITAAVSAFVFASFATAHCISIWRLISRRRTAAKANSPTA